ncbi:MAG TPA: APC family permease [Tepidisphaeraceae bacterium]|nr:APC family permease [Tepidisphaeraceae bacterium]
MTDSTGSPASDAAAPPLPADKPASHGELARTMGLVSLIIYGVGDMLGAGVYGLVGKAAGLMGNAVWLAFAGSMVAAMLTGLSYANIGSRYPRAAGAAYVTHRAYGWPYLSYLVGLAVAASGLTSMATGSRVIAGFLQTLGLALPAPALVVLFLLFIAAVVFRGMRESAWLNAICTAVEVGGLMIVIGVGIRYWGSVNYFETPPHPDGSAGALSLTLVLNGAVLTFFSFIGFEDMLNVAEECKDARRTIPIALICALIIGTVIYMAVSITAVSVLHYSELAKSPAALVDVVRKAAPWFPPILFTGISIFAVSNTALLNYVMGSRLLYGMSRQGLLPAPLGRVHATRRTPHVAIGVLLLVVTALALSGDIRQLADSTSLLLLGVFCVVNTALIILKFRDDEPRGAFEVPAVVPALGVLVCLTLIAARLFGAGADRKAPLIAGAIGLVITALYFVLRPKHVVMDDDDHGDGDRDATAQAAA